MKQVYDPSFYSNRDAMTRSAAQRILKLVVPKLHSCRSAVDFGCGVGTWLSVLQLEHGTRDVLGLDGEWVDPSDVLIPRDSFIAMRLDQPISLERTFDLAISLEVAEHIDAGSADEFVSSIADHANAILFSAAVPLQDGVGHVNEQPPGYWAQKFARLGYFQSDCLRHVIWEQADIPFWYRQNSFLYLDRQHYDSETDAEGFSGAYLIHPDNYQRKCLKLRELREQSPSDCG